ncbi:MAG: carboxypeptidase M32 [Alkalispirochaeta sp.]
MTTTGKDNSARETPPGGPEEPTELRELAELKELDRESRLLEHTAAVLSWDQETYMPDQAVVERAGQQALLQSLVHQRNTAARVGELLSVLTDTATAGVREEDRAFVREKRRQYEQAVRVSERLVRELAEAGSRGQHAWAAARKADDYSLFKPWLTKLLSLSREMADALGHGGNRYDALLDQYEPYARTDEVAAVFATLRDGLVDLVDRIRGAKQVDTSFLERSYAVNAQEELSRRVMGALGYDLSRGRLDRSAHPFTTTLGANDVRITTRFSEDMVTSGLFSTIHETGHALYELGVDETLGGTLLAEGTSLGIHESQSRMWENVIGRSRHFWRHWLPEMKQMFPTQLKGVSLEQFYRAINRVEPSLIRVEADEVTYSLHIIMRFELEQALIQGDLSVDDLPGAWREKSRLLLGVEPDTDAQGVLQDVHWSFGAFGYFPTYALGNLYAAQFLPIMEQRIDNLWDGVAEGRTDHILEWLRENIHRHGKVRSAGTLVQDITGDTLNPQYFLDYLNDKYGDIYQV